MHYQHLHGGDLNENGNFKDGKLVLHDQILHVGDLNENKDFKDPKMLAFARQRNSQLQLLLVHTNKLIFVVLETPADFAQQLRIQRQSVDVPVVISVRKYIMKR